MFKWKHFKQYFNSSHFLAWTATSKMMTDKDRDDMTARGNCSYRSTHGLFWVHWLYLQNSTSKSLVSSTTFSKLSSFKIRTPSSSSTSVVAWHTTDNRSNKPEQCNFIFKDEINPPIPCYEMNMIKIKTTPRNSQDRGKERNESECTLWWVVLFLYNVDVYKFGILQICLNCALFATLKDHSLFYCNIFSTTTWLHWCIHPMNSNTYLGVSHLSAPRYSGRGDL